MSGNQADPAPRRRLFGNRPAWASVASRAEPETTETDLFARKAVNLSNPLANVNKKTAPLEDKYPVHNETTRETETQALRTPKRRRISRDDDGVLTSSASSVHVGSSPSSAHDYQSTTRIDDIVPRVGSATASSNPEDSTYTSQSHGSALSLQRSPEQIDPVHKLDTEDFEITTESDEGADNVAKDTFRKKTESSSGAIRAQSRKIPSKNNSTAIEATDEVVDIIDSSPPPSPDLSANRSQHQPVSRSSKQQHPGTDAIVRLLIHSRIPDTEPLIVHRKLSQRLKEVRMAWCAKQGLSDLQTAEVFLTWRGQQLYDFTNCRSLGISVNEEGDATFRGNAQTAFAENAQLEMEAVTQQILDDDKKLQEEEAASAKKEKERQLLSADNGGSMASTATAAQQSGIRIILKAPGYEDYKLIVKPTTTFSQIVRTFRKQRAVPHEKSAFLMFDGERLAEQETIADSEISDMDNVEVYVR